MPPSKKQKRSEHHMSDSATAGQQQQQQHQQQRQHCLLLDSGVLSVLLHHTSFIDHHSIICKLLCCSAELSAVVTTQCRGLVTLTSHQQVPPAWIRQHAPLLRCLRVDFSLLSDEARAAAEDSLARVLCEVEPQLLLSGFISKDHYVSVPLLKRLPVSSLTRLHFQDCPVWRHDHALNELLLLKSRKGGKNNTRAQRRAVKQQGLTGLAQACRRLSGLRELEVTTVDKGHADCLMPQVAFLKHLTKLHLNVVLSPNKRMATHMPKGLKVLQLTYKNTKHPQPQLDLSKLKSLWHLDLFNAPLRHTDILPPSLTHLSAGSATSLAPLLPLTHLHSLNISAAARLAVSDAPVLPYAELSRLVRVTCLVVSGQVLPPEATLPQALRELQLEGLRDSTKQLTGLQSLTKLRINTLEVDPPALAHLTALTNLAHISWGLISPLPDAPRLTLPGPQEASLALHLAQWSTWPLPLAELSLRGEVLSPDVMQLLGKLRSVTKLELQGCMGRMGRRWSKYEPYKCLSDPIRTWTQLQSLIFKGDVWSISHVPDLATSLQRFMQVSRATREAPSGGGPCADDIAAAVEELATAMAAMLSVSNRAGAAANGQGMATMPGPVTISVVRELVQAELRRAGMPSASNTPGQETSAASSTTVEQTVVSPSADEVTALHQLMQAPPAARAQAWCKLLVSAVGSLTQLTTLDLSGWPLSESVTNLRPLTRLRSLSVESTSQSDASLLGLLPALRLLTHLSIAGNVKVTLTPLAAMGLVHPDLKLLDVRHNPQIEGPRAGLEQWMLQHPHVAVVRTMS